MRTKNTILVLLAALLLPATLVAGERNSHRRGEYNQHQPAGDHRELDGSRHGRHDRHRGPMLVVKNPNAEPVQVYLDGQPVGQVAPQSKERFRNVSFGRHLVEVRYEDPQLRRQPRLYENELFVGRGRTVVEADYARVALLEVQNSWVQPLELLINGRSRGPVQGRSDRLVMHRDGALLELRAPGGQVVLKQRLYGAGLATTALAFQPAAWSTVSVHNPTRARLQLVDRASGKLLAQLAPKRTSQVRVPSGKARLAVQFGGRTIDRKRMLAVPWTANRWSVQAPTTAPLTLSNSNRMDLAVYIDGRYLGRVEAHSSRTFADVPVGSVEVRVEAKRRHRVYSQTAQVHVESLFGGRLDPQLALHDGRHARRGGRHGHWGRYGGRHGGRSSRR